MESFGLAGFQIYRFEPAQGKARARVLFSHANGIAALTYRHLLAQWSSLWQVEIYAYDLRGMGKTTAPKAAALRRGKRQLLTSLTKDLVQLWEGLEKRHPHPGSGPERLPWILSGHSLGGWLSLLAASHIPVTRLVVLDPPFLSLGQAAQWSLACLFGLRHRHPLALAARRRRRSFASEANALSILGRSPFFRRWQPEKMEEYLRANYWVRQGQPILRHSPHWEADIFESLPSSCALQLLKIPKEMRHRWQVLLITGADSSVCPPELGPLYRSLLPQLQWVQVAQGSHMFPFENESSLLGLLDALPGMSEMRYFFTDNS